MQRQGRSVTANIVYAAWDGILIEKELNDDRKQGTEVKDTGKY